MENTKLLFTKFNCHFTPYVRTPENRVLTCLLCGLRYGLCALGRIRHLVRH